MSLFPSFRPSIFSLGLSVSLPSVCVSLCLSVCVCLSLSPSLSVFLSLSVFMSLSVCLSVSLFLSPEITVPVGWALNTHNSVRSPRPLLLLAQREDSNTTDRCTEAYKQRSTPVLCTARKQARSLALGSPCRRHSIRRMGCCRRTGATTASPPPPPPLSHTHTPPPPSKLTSL